MSVRVKIPAQLRSLAADNHELKVDGAETVRALLGSIQETYPKLIERIIDEETGEIRRFINLFVGDEDVRFLDGLDTPVPPTALISILPAVAGG